MSGACEFLKEQIGTPVSSIIEKYDNLDEPPGGGDPTATYVKEYDSLNLCENSQLENSVLKVFIKEGKLIGTEIEGALGEAKNNKIIDFAKTHLGYKSEVDFDPSGEILSNNLVLFFICARSQDAKYVGMVSIFGNSARNGFTIKLCTIIFTM